MAVACSGGKLLRHKNLVKAKNVTGFTKTRLSIPFSTD